MSASRIGEAFFENNLQLIDEHITLYSRLLLSDKHLCYDYMKVKIEADRYII